MEINQGLLHVLCFCGLANPSASVNACRRKGNSLPTPMEMFTNSSLNCTNCCLRTHAPGPSFYKSRNRKEKPWIHGRSQWRFHPHTPLVLLNQSCLGSFYYVYGLALSTVLDPLTSAQLLNRSGLRSRSWGRKVSIHDKQIWLGYSFHPFKNAK